MRSERAVRGAERLARTFSNETADLARIANAALDAPPDPAAAFDALTLLMPPSDGRAVLLARGRRPTAWHGRLLVPLDSMQGPAGVIASPFYLVAYAMAQRGTDMAVATMLLHAEAPADRLTTPIDLKVADLERALRFYRDVLGFELTQRYGQDAAFVSAGGYHHHIGLNVWESRGGSPPPRGTTGLYHLAILYPDRAALADALRRVLAAGIRLDGASDHGVSEALYLRDPDGNGIELYWDKPQSEWPRTADGKLAMHTRRLDVPSLLKAAA